MLMTIAHWGRLALLDFRFVRFDPIEKLHARTAGREIALDLGDQRCMCYRIAG